jgi:hypothetical protein
VRLRLEVAPKAWATVGEIYGAYEEWADEHGGPEHAGEDRLSSRDVTGYLVATYALARGKTRVDGKQAKTLFGVRVLPPAGTGTDGTDSQEFPGEIDLQKTPGTSVPTVPGTISGPAEPAYCSSCSRFRCICPKGA